MTVVSKLNLKLLLFIYNDNMNRETSLTCQRISPIGNYKYKIKCHIVYAMYNLHCIQSEIKSIIFVVRNKF